MKRIIYALAVLSSMGCYRVYPHEKLMRKYRDSVDYWGKLAQKEQQLHDSTTPRYMELAGRAYNDLDSLKKYGNLAVQEFINRK